MKRVLIFLFSIMFCVTILTQQAYCDDSKVTWPTPQILQKGEIAQDDYFVFTEEQFTQLLWTKAYFQIMSREWVAKEEVYNNAIKELAKKAKVPFWKSFRAGFLMGIGLIVLSVWAVGQIN